MTARLERARDPAKVALALRDLLELSADAGPVDAGTAERALRLAERAARDLEGAGGAQTHAWHALLDVFVRLDEKERVLGVLEALASRSATHAEHAEYDLLIAHRLLALPGRREDAIERLWDLVRKDAAHTEPYELLAELLQEGAGYDPLLELCARSSTSPRPVGRRAAEVLAQRLGIALERAGRLRDALDAYSRLGNTLRAAAKRWRRSSTCTSGSERKAGSSPTRWRPARHRNRPERAAALTLRLADLRRQEWDEEAVERALEKASRSRRCVWRSRSLGQAPARARSSRTRGFGVERAIEHMPSTRSCARVSGRRAVPRRDSERALQALEAALAARAPEPRCAANALAFWKRWAARTKPWLNSTLRCTQRAARRRATGGHRAHARVRDFGALGPASRGSVRGSRATRASSGVA